MFCQNRLFIFKKKESLQLEFHSIFIKIMSPKRTSVKKHIRECIDKNISIDFLTSPSLSLFSCETHFFVDIAVIYYLEVKSYLPVISYRLFLCYHENKNQVLLEWINSFQHMQKEEKKKPTTQCYLTSSNRCEKCLLSTSEKHRKDGIAQEAREVLNLGSFLLTKFCLS